MSQLQDERTSGSEDSGNAQVFVTSPSNPEEQMQELQRRLNQIEREAAQRLAQFEREIAQRQEIEAKMRADAEAEAARKLAEKEEEIAALIAKCALLMNDKGKNKTNEGGSSKTNNDEHDTMSP